ncbi:MAG TPA: hypothetical protein PK400_00630 [Phycisphaerales bacterium]|nr:hypothetical protein [Phycisphaerales bacterium]HRQ74428.1 hypothetical protein [Phycisphaerales bacterium]
MMNRSERRRHEKEAKRAMRTAQNSKQRIEPVHAHRLAQREAALSVDPPKPVVQSSGPTVATDAVGRGYDELTAPVYLAPCEVCRRLSISRSTLDRLGLPGRVKVGGQVRYHWETLEAAIRSGSP